MLCLLVILLLSSLDVQAHVSSDNQRFMEQTLTDLLAIEPSHQACQMKTESENLIRQRRDTLLYDRPQETDLFIFVSTSLHQDHLLKLGREAKAHGGVLVLKGFVQESLKSTLKTLMFLFQNDIGVLIDPDLFAEYQVVHVPTIVLTDRKMKDQVAGVSVVFALHLFRDQGELSDDAQRRIEW